MTPRLKPKRPGQRFSFSSSLSRLSWTHRVLVAFTAAVVTVLFLLAAHAHVAPRQNSGMRSGLGRKDGFHTSGHLRSLAKALREACPCVSPRLCVVCHDLAW